MTTKYGSAQEIDQRLQKLSRQSRLGGKLLGIGLLMVFGTAILYAVLVMLATDLLESFGAMYFVPVPDGFLMIIIGAVITSKTGRERSQIQDAYIPITLEQAMDRVDQFWGATLDERYFKEELGLPMFDECSQSSYLKGVLRGIPLEMSCFVLKKETTKDDDNQPNYEITFSGLMIVCRHTMELKEEGFAFTQFTRLLGGMKTESEAFNKAFSIYAEGGLDVFRLLTPQYMEHLVSLPEAREKELGVRLCQDGTLLIVLEHRRIIVDSDDITTGSGMVEYMADHIRGIADTIDSLELPIQREA